jgi:hypothetical protein
MYKAEGNNPLLPTWTAVDANSVKTARELWEHLADEGWKVEVSDSCSFDHFL